MKFFKNILIALGKIYFNPFFLTQKLYLKVKDLYFTSPSEHLFRAVELVRQKNGPGEKITVIDVGAADGSTAVFFCKELKPSALLAFEPNPLMHETIRKNLSAFPAVRFKNQALGSNAGIATLNTTQNNVSSSLLNVESGNKHAARPDESYLKVVAHPAVAVSTLDAEAAEFESIDLLKMDVQGYEIEVLKGGLQTLKKTKLILVEMSSHSIYTGGCKYYEVDEFLRHNGFRLADILVAYRPKGRMEEYDAIYEKAE